ncbi:hypothetical protein HDU76_014060 [Blyttiomyces sp. JEL0837]|nr:hypothetical protein HDU76_014060 [Blyttiomyces sp. JEL0837]
MSGKVQGITAPHKPITTIARHAYITQTPLWQQRDELSQKNGPHATVYMINGDRYLGEWKGNKKHGNGTYFYRSTGAIYEGEWLNDMRHGYGTFSIPSVPIPLPPSQTASTSSPTNNDSRPIPSSPTPIPSSHTTKNKNPYNLHNVDLDSITLRKVYAGEWRNDKREGLGTYFYDDGGWYEGYWLGDQKEGWGKMNYVDGSVYEGEWHREMRHGQGILLLRE